MKESVIRARIDPALKAQACAVLASCGLQPSDAIRLFLQQVVRHGGIPFEIRASDVEYVPAGELWAMKRAAQQRDHWVADHAGVSDNDMMLIKPDELRGVRISWPSARLDD